MNFRAIFSILLILGGLLCFTSCGDRNKKTVKVNVISSNGHSIQELKEHHEIILKNWPELYKKLKKDNPEWNGKYEFIYFSAKDSLKIIAPSLKAGKSKLEVSNAKFIRGIDFTAADDKDNSVLIVKMRNLDALKTMPFLELNLSYNTIQDIKALEELKTLEILNITASEVRDISPLKKLPLKVLLAGNCKIEDLSPLDGKDMDSLDLKNCPAAEKPLPINLRVQNIFGISQNRQ